jgi:hypothetical protein
MDQHEPAAADIAAAWIDDSQRITDRDCGIDRIAARLQNARSDLGSQPMRRDDHTMLSLDRWSREQSRWV